MCSHPDLINIQSKAHGQLGLVYFLLPEGYFLSRFVVLSSVFVFASDENDRVYSQRMRVNREMPHSLEIKQQERI